MTRKLVSVDKSPASVANFLSFINKVNGCWEWAGAKTDNGYGAYMRYRAHRYSFILFNGDITDGLLVLHKCDNPPCVNPSHLFLGTQSDNIKDCVSKGRWIRTFKRPRSTSCKNGHCLLLKENTIGTKRIRCKICNSLWQKDYKRRKNEKNNKLA